jgi:hypothetical protein
MNSLSAQEMMEIRGGWDWFQWISGFVYGGAVSAWLF